MTPLLSTSFPRAPTLCHAQPPEIPPNLWCTVTISARLNPSEPPTPPVPPDPPPTAGATPWVRPIYNYDSTRSTLTPTRCEPHERPKLAPPRLWLLSSPPTLSRQMSLASSENSTITTSRLCFMLHKSVAFSPDLHSRHPNPDPIFNCLHHHRSAFTPDLPAPSESPSTKANLDKSLKALVPSPTCSISFAANSIYTMHLVSFSPIGAKEVTVTTCALNFRAFDIMNLPDLRRLYPSHLLGFLSPTHQKSSQPLKLHASSNLWAPQSLLFVSLNALELQISSMVSLLSTVHVPSPMNRSPLCSSVVSSAIFLVFSGMFIDQLLLQQLPPTTVVLLVYQLSQTPVSLARYGNRRIFLLDSCSLFTRNHLSLWTISQHRQAATQSRLVSSTLLILPAIFKPHDMDEPTLDRFFSRAPQAEVVSNGFSETKAWKDAQPLRHSTPQAHPTRLIPSPSPTIDFADATWHDPGSSVVAQGSATHLHISSALLGKAIVLKTAIEAAHSLEFHHLTVRLDSQSLVSLINSKSDINELKSVLVDIRLLETFSFISIFYVSSLNVRVDSLAKEALSLA